MPANRQFLWKKHPAKLHPVTEGISLSLIQVHKYDIDSNNHVNNERYVPMAMECLPDGFTHPSASGRISQFRRIRRYDLSILSSGR
ncbi:MAG: hypothetical protein ACLUD0_20445 [Eubacterium ramulus]